MTTERKGHMLRSATEWTCDVCGMEGEWAEGWHWAGDYRNFSEHHKKAIVVTCSQACKDKADIKAILQERGINAANE